MANANKITSGVIAKMFNVSPNSIKNWSDEWEKAGLLTPIPRTPGGHRLYSPEHVEVFRRQLSSQPKDAAAPVDNGQGG